MQPAVALITGGIRGIGRSVALRLAKQGWSIATCFRQNHAQADHLAAELSALHRQHLVSQVDIGDPKASERWVEHVTQHFGHIDALIHCAGYFHRVALFEDTVERWQTTFATHLHALYYLSRCVAPQMRARHWGRIVSFAASNADQLRAFPYVTAFHLAKTGVIQLTRALAHELAPWNITANTISPGFIDSGSPDDRDLDDCKNHVPAGYVGTVDDTSSAVQFLLSEKARYVTGTNLHVSGGWGV